MIINEGMIINEDTWMIKTKGWSYLWTKGWWWSRTKDNHHRGQKFNNKQNHLCEQRDDDDKQKDNGHCGQKIDNKQNDAKQKDDREQEDGDHYGKKNYHDQAEDHYKTWKKGRRSMIMDKRMNMIMIMSQKMIIDMMLMMAMCFPTQE